jgi:hypothetical protein
MPDVFDEGRVVHPPRIAAWENTRRIPVFGIRFVLRCRPVDLFG